MLTLCVTAGALPVSLLISSPTLRELGQRLIDYIDNILVMAETESLLRDHTTAVIRIPAGKSRVCHPNP